MPEARKIVPAQPERVQVLAAAISTDPLFFAVDRPEGKVLVLTVNLDKGDLPLRTAFPISVGNALHWFAGNKSDLRESLAAGSMTAVTSSDFAKLPQGKELNLISPAGQPKRLPVNADKITLGPLDQCGIWKIVEAHASETSPGAAKPGAAKPGAAKPGAANRVRLLCCWKSHVISPVRRSLTFARRKNCLPKKSRLRP